MSVQQDSADGKTAGTLMGRTWFQWPLVSARLLVVVRSGDLRCSFFVPGMNTAPIEFQTTKYIHHTDYYLTV